MSSAHPLEGALLAAGVTLSRESKRQNRVRSNRLAQGRSGPVAAPASVMQAGAELFTGEEVLRHIIALVPLTLLYGHCSQTEIQ